MVAVAVNVVYLIVGVYIGFGQAMQTGGGGAQGGYMAFLGLLYICMSVKSVVSLVYLCDRYERALRCEVVKEIDRGYRILLHNG